MPTFHPSSPLVTNIDDAVLAAQRETNALRAGFPHPDVRTPPKASPPSNLTANNDQGTVLTPSDRTVEIGHGAVRLHTFAPAVRRRHTADPRLLCRRTARGSDVAPPTGRKPGNVRPIRQAVLDSGPHDSASTPRANSQATSVRQLFLTR